jgi:hypothetical protein
MENIASVFTHKTWRTGGLSAATKSMFKSRVDFKKPVRPAKPAALPTVHEAVPSPVPSPSPPTHPAGRTPSSTSRQALLTPAAETSSPVIL